MAVSRFAPPVAPSALAALAFGVVPLLGLLWPSLAPSMSVARPADLGAVLWDGALCFGPLGVPLLGVGSVVVSLERKG
jgi:hypothetical protein